jgi:hypothetical protein
MVESDGAPAVRNVEPSPLLPLLRVPYVEAVGVGSKDPDSIPSVRSANGGRGETSPFRIEPESGKVPKDSIETPSAEGGGVLNERERRFSFADDACELAPQPRSCAVESSASTCERDILTGEPSGDDVDASTPRPPVEGAHVVVDLNLGELRTEDLPTIRVDLDGASGGPSEDRTPVQSTAGAGEEIESSHTGISEPSRATRKPSGIGRIFPSANR